MTRYKEVALGRHYVTFGYNLKSFSFAFTINRYGLDIYFYPFVFQFEYRGLEIQKRFEERLSALNGDQV